MGKLPIKDLPGMPAAVTATFDKAWRAGIDLSVAGHPRSDALASLEHAVIQCSPTLMKRPGDLAAMALQRIGQAPAVIGPLEIQGHSEMSPCWRLPLIALAGIIPVSWIAGPRQVPDWLKGSRAKPAAIDKGSFRVGLPDRAALLSPFDQSDRDSVASHRHVA
ncbi:hypothetical protein ACVINW_003690 [Bradyrhizobium sp. USDA 4461]